MILPDIFASFETLILLKKILQKWRYKKSAQGVILFWAILGYLISNTSKSVPRARIHFIRVVTISGLLCPQCPCIIYILIIFFYLLCREDLLKNNSNSSPPFMPLIKILESMHPYNTPFWGVSVYCKSIIRSLIKRWFP